MTLTSNAISDLILATVAIGATISLWRSPDAVRPRTWALFSLLMGVTAGLGTLRFAGIDDLAPWVDIGKALTGTCGAAGLVLGAWSTVRDPLSDATVGLVLSAALLLALLVIALPGLSLPVQGLAILSLLVLAVSGAAGNPGLFRGLLTGILAVAAAIGGATGIRSIVGNTSLAVDFYHVWMAVAVALFARAAIIGGRTARRQASAP